MDFCDKVVIVTGASSGIGKACALHFAKHSAKLTLVGRNEENLNQVKDECEELSGTKHFVIIADISKEDDVYRISKETINHYGKIDVLVNNAGIVHKGGVMDSITNIVDNLMAQAVLPYIIKTEGHIVDLSSISSTSPVSSWMGNCMTKAAVNKLTKYAALDVAPKGLRLNSMLINSEANNQLYPQVVMTIPLKEVANVNNFAKLVLVLASDFRSTHLFNFGMHLGVPIM